MFLSKKLLAILLLILFINQPLLSNDLQNITDKTILMKKELEALIRALNCCKFDLEKLFIINDKTFPTYYNMAKEICDKVGMEIPTICLSFGINGKAYAVPDPKDLYIVLDKSIFEENNYEEVQGVVAHELGHIYFRHQGYASKRCKKLRPLTLVLLYLYTSIGVFICLEDEETALRNIAVLSLSSVTSFILSFKFINKLYKKGRNDEKQADLFAVSTVGSKGLISHLSNSDWTKGIPYFYWRYPDCTHPPFDERKKYMEEFEEQLKQNTNLALAA